eukprot:scaffold24202_cov129-Isochrysis_galbana.AAC.2
MAATRGRGAIALRMARAREHAVARACRRGTKYHTMHKYSTQQPMQPTIHSNQTLEPEPQQVVLTATTNNNNDDHDAHHRPQNHHRE